MVVIHEAFGLNENIRDVARRFAAHGYAAFAVDLFAGRNRAVCTARFMGGMLRGKPRPFGVVGDLERALSVLGEQPGVDAERLGAIGFCMGGGYALAWACNDDGLKAIAPYYDANPRPLAAVARSCPVVGSYPEKDFTALSARKLDAELAPPYPARRQDLPGCPALLLQRPWSRLRPRSRRRFLAPHARLLRRAHPLATSRHTNPCLPLASDCASTTFVNTLVENAMD